MNTCPGPLDFAPYKGIEFGPKAANPPRSCRNAAGRLRHRRSELQCPLLTLRAASIPSSPRRGHRPASDAAAGRLPCGTLLAFGIVRSAPV